VIDMLDRALAAGVPFRYFTADSGYGRDPALRTRCHATALSYVLAVPVDLPLVEPAGAPTRPDRVRATVPKTVWERRSCGNGTKDARYYDWVAVAVTVKDQPPADGYRHTLLIRRSVSDPPRSSSSSPTRPCPPRSPS
jgi:SRSO17 transposase